MRVDHWIKIRCGDPIDHGTRRGHVIAILHGATVRIKWDDDGSRLDVPLWLFQPDARDHPKLTDDERVAIEAAYRGDET